MIVLCLAILVVLLNADLDQQIHIEYMCPDGGIPKVKIPLNRQAVIDWVDVVERCWFGGFFNDIFSYEDVWSTVATNAQQCSDGVCTSFMDEDIIADSYAMRKIIDITSTTYIITEITDNSFKIEGSRRVKLEAHIIDKYDVDDAFSDDEFKEEYTFNDDGTLKEDTMDTADGLAKLLIDYGEKNNVNGRNEENQRGNRPKGGRGNFNGPNGNNGNNGNAGNGNNANNGAKRLLRCTCETHQFVACGDQMDCNDFPNTICESRTLHHTDRSKDTKRRCCFPADDQDNDMVYATYRHMAAESTNYYFLEMVGVVILLVLNINCWCYMFYQEKRKNRLKKVQYTCTSSEDEMLIN